SGASPSAADWSRATNWAKKPRWYVWIRVSLARVAGPVSAARPPRGETLNTRNGQRRATAPAGLNPGWRGRTDRMSAAPEAPGSKRATPASASLGQAPVYSGVRGLPTMSSSGRGRLTGHVRQAILDTRRLYSSAAGRAIQEERVMASRRREDWD